jgi:hypothetical protein
MNRRQLIVAVAAAATKEITTVVDAMLLVRCLTTRFVERLAWVRLGRDRNRHRTEGPAYLPRLASLHF